MKGVTQRVVTVKDAGGEAGDQEQSTSMEATVVETHSEDAQPQRRRECHREVRADGHVGKDSERTGSADDGTDHCSSCKTQWRLESPGKWRSC